MGCYKNQSTGNNEEKKEKGGEVEQKSPEIIAFLEKPLVRKNSAGEGKGRGKIEKKDSYFKYPFLFSSKYQETMAWIWLSVLLSG